MAGIIGLSGQPGAGKSYTAVDLFILPALQEGRPIVTNVPLQMDAIQADFPAANIQSVQVDEFQWDLKNLPPGCLLVLDEIWKLWPQGKQLKNIPVSEMAVLKEHRHHSDASGRSMDIVLISQDMNDLCKPVRELIESTIICIKHLDLGKENAFIRWYCKKACSLEKNGLPPNNQINRSENVKYKDSVYRYYKTHMHGMGAVNPNEKRIVSNSIFGSFKWKAGLAVAGGAIVLMLWSAGKTQENIKKATTKPQTAPVAQTEHQQKPLVTTEAAQPQSQYSERWRIAGVFYNFGGTGHDRYYLINDNKRLRTIDGDKCKMDDYEPVCDVDGQKITFYSGDASPGYLPASQATPPS